MAKMGQKNPNKKKKAIRKKLPKLYALDILFSKIVRTLADYTCEYCGRKYDDKGKQLAMHCHHGVVHRTYRMTRFEIENCTCVCIACHNFLGNFPKLNTEFFQKRIGSDRMEQLERMARSGEKIDLVAVKQRLDSQAKTLGIK